MNSESSNIPISLHIVPTSQLIHPIRIYHPSIFFSTSLSNSTSSTEHDEVLKESRRERAMAKHCGRRGIPSLNEIDQRRKGEDSEAGRC
jgi:hypothetical protein